MDDAFITEYITSTHADVEVLNHPELGYRFFFYKDDHMVPFVTIATADNEHDSISQLDRPGVFRLNVGAGREHFQALFGSEKVELSDYDFTALDTLMPHPDYAPQGFICVLNPSAATFERLRPLIADAYERAARRYNRRTAPQS